MCLSLLLLSVLVAVSFAALSPANPPALINTDNVDVVIFYNGLIYPKREHWLELMKEQLEELKCNGLARRAKSIHISLTIEYASQRNSTAAGFVKQTVSALQKIHPNAAFDITLENRFEYPALRRMWDTAQNLAADEAQKTVFVYLHSKGMVNTHLSKKKFHGVRVPIEYNIFRLTFDPWDTALHMLSKHPTIDKIGCFPAAGGFIWNNFWYARASYIQKLLPPTITKNRYYYEAWLSYLDNDKIWPKVRHIEFVEQDVPPLGKLSDCSNCWSTLQGVKNETLGVTYDPEQIFKNLKAPRYKCRK